MDRCGLITNKMNSIIIIMGSLRGQGGISPKFLVTDSNFLEVI